MGDDERREQQRVDFLKKTNRNIEVIVSGIYGLIAELEDLVQRKARGGRVAQTKFKLLESLNKLERQFTQKIRYTDQEYIDRVYQESDDIRDKVDQAIERSENIGEQGSVHSPLAF